MVRLIRQQTISKMAANDNKDENNVVSDIAACLGILVFQRKLVDTERPWTWEYIISL